MNKWTKKKKGIAVSIAALFLLIAGILFFGFYMKDLNALVSVYLDGDKTASIGDTVTVNVKVTNITQDFQASSFAITYNQKKLYLEEVEQGNVEAIEQSTGEVLYPEWQYDLDVANRDGSLNIMYLDMTAGEQPICPEGFEEKKKDVLFRLTFRVLSTCAEDETLDLSISQASLASVEEENSLSLQKENLKVEGCAITVKE